tara:strand:+ start:322 stop:531 length:210 start_codon:yes stop_codon:yes gene_type:complete
MIKKLDLHGIRHSEVDRLVENFVLLNKTPMRIVTGNSDKMIELVKNTLERLDIGYESFRPGLITILDYE